MEETVRKILEELFSLIGIKADFKIDVKDSEGGKEVDIEIESEASSGLLIGGHGSTLDAIQYFLGLALRNEIGEQVRVNVDIAGWKEKQEDRLKTLALHTAEMAIKKKEPQYLYNLTPAERRIIHLALVDNKEVKTESQGEGEERFLVVEPVKH